ncbi:hypothetical protein PR048_008392 [Dryococelus australis]|uniref:Uncharacterized protein n=1 Tax=Dryococelus australis TaxID=614101 RepID=A0ABQ9HWZ9_9NEOP|nr:hypothetical protein PR048_008392 [Dryococelus australis]
MRQLIPVPVQCGSSREVGRPLPFCCTTRIAYQLGQHNTNLPPHKPGHFPLESQRRDPTASKGDIFSIPARVGFPKRTARSVKALPLTPTDFKSKMATRQGKWMLSACEFSWWSPLDREPYLKTASSKSGHRDK